MEPKDTGVSNKAIELKRSARLSKKRTLQDNLVTKFSDGLDDSNDGVKLSKILKSKKNKAEIYETRKNDIKKINYRDSVKSTINTSSELSNMMNIQSSPNTTVDNVEKTRVKILPITFKNKNSSKPPMVTCVQNLSKMNNVNTEVGVGSKHEKSNGLDKFIRKRGRPSRKEPQLLLRDAGKVNTSCSDEVDQQKTGKGFVEPLEKSDDVYESEFSTLNENDHTWTAESNSCDDESSKPKRKQIGIKSSTANVEIAANDSCTLEDTTELQVKTVPAVMTSENKKVLRDAKQPSRDHETFDREITLISNRFNIPCDTLRNIIEKESISVFREKYSDTVTMSMVTVSPVVSMTDKGKRRNLNGSIVKYKIEPARATVAYGKTNLKDTMEEISKTMPSWSLSIVADPPRYVISHMSIETYGTPIANKSVVLDRYFRASVYINQRLEYKYCKRYTTASEIVDLIKELDALI